MKQGNKNEIEVFIQIIDEVVFCLEELNFYALKTILDKHKKEVESILKKYGRDDLIQRIENLGSKEYQKKLSKNVFTLIKNFL